MAETNQITLPIERTAPTEATQLKKSGRRGMGRRKIPMQRIVNNEHRLITFSKRRAGIFKKAMEISTLCGVDIGVLIFSPAGKPHAYGVPNIESVSDKFLWGMNSPQNENLSSTLMESQRRVHVAMLNRDYDELSVYLQSLKKDADKLMEMKKKEFVDGCLWDFTVEDLKPDEMEKVTMAMEDIRKKASKRLKELKEGASSSWTMTIQPNVQISKDGGFGYGGADGYCNFTKGDSSTMVEGVQGGVPLMDRNLGQGYKDNVGGGGGFSDWRDGASTTALVGIQGGGHRVDVNAGLSGYGGNYGGLGKSGMDGATAKYSFFQAGAMQLGGKGGDGHGKSVSGSFGDSMIGVSSLATIHQGAFQIGENGGASFGDFDVSSGGVGKLRPTLTSVTSLAIQPAVGSVLVGGNGSGGYGGGIASCGGLGGGWRAVASSSTSSPILGANPMQMDGNEWSGNLWGSGGGGSGGGDLMEFGTLSVQMGGNGGTGYKGYVGASGGLRGASSSSSLQPNPIQMGGNGRLVYGSIGGGGGFAEFAIGGSSSSSLEPDVEFGNKAHGTNNGFMGFYSEGSGGLE